MLRRHFPIRRCFPTSRVAVVSVLSTSLRFCSSNGKPTSWFDFVQQQQQQQTPTATTSPQQQQQPEPPTWFRQLCEDLHFRRDSATTTTTTTAVSPEEDFDEIARNSGEAMQLDAENESDQPTRRKDGDGDNNNDTVVVDPFLWLEFNILPEEQYRFERFEFPAATTPFSEEAQNLLSGGGNERRVMCCFATAYKFPDRRQLPVSVGTEPCFLWVDPTTASSSTATPVVYIQLSREFPPALWLPVKGTARAVRRVLAEFATSAAVHRDRHEAMWTRRWESAAATLKRQQVPHKLRGDRGGDVLRTLSFAATKESYDAKLVREFHNSQEFFLGEFDNPEQQVQMHCDLCSALFSTPLFRTQVNLHEPQHTPTVDGPGVATSLYRTVFSKSLLLLQVHLATEVKLPPLDPDAFKLLWSETSAQAPPSRVPVFVRVIWPDNERMCGGGAVVRNINRAFGTEFAHDVPVDVCFALLYLTHWIKREKDFLGVHGMRRRVLELERQLLNPTNQLGGSTTDSVIETTSTSSSSSLYPGTAEIPCPHYSLEERLAMHIQYSAHLGDPLAAETIKHFMRHHSAAIRLGCAKAALELGDKKLFKRIAESEPDGRTQRVLTTLVVKRKKRDLLDPEPRFDDSQFEFPAPLWAGSARIDPTTQDGARYLARMKARGSGAMHRGLGAARTQESHADQFVHDT